MKPPWFTLAASALTSARDRDPFGAVAATQQLVVLYGPDVLPEVMLAWIDSMAARCGLDPEGRPVGIAWMNEDTGEITDADRTPPAARWAGQLIGARLADDEDQYRALIDSCATDEEWSENVRALLMSCGAMLRAAVSS